MSFAILEYDKHKAEFAEWLARSRDQRTYERYIKFLNEFLSGKVITTPRELAEEMSKYEKETGKKFNRHRKIAIRNYLNFLVEKAYYRKSQVIDYFPVLKLESTGVKKTKIPTEEELIRAHEYLLAKSKENPEAYEKRLLAFYLMVFGGVRLTEACDILTSFDRSELEIFDNFARYDILAMYKRIGSTKAKADQSKKAWVCYMPVWVAKQLKRIKVSWLTINGYRFADNLIHPGDIRDWFSSFLARQGVEERIIEFMTGKTPSTILRKHYLDLLREADEVYAKLVDKFPIKEVR